MRAGVDAGLWAALSSVENAEAEADEGRFNKEIFRSNNSESITISSERVFVLDSLRDFERDAKTAKFIC
jgi:hypothetical protein